MGVVKIEVRRQGHACVLRISGEISLGSSTALLRRKCREVVEAGERCIVLDMLNVTWLDSSGIGEVMACFKRARASGGSLRLVLKGKSRSLFTFTELHRVIPVFEDLDDAVAGFDEPSSSGGEGGHDGRE
jgi:anti-sigma B factor antagonist